MGTHKKIIAAGILGILLALAAGGWYAARERNAHSQKIQENTVYYFYEEACGSCDGQGEFITLFHDRLNGVSLPEIHIQCFNTFREGKEFWEELCEELQIPKEERITPMVIAGNRYVTGEDAISEQLRAITCAMCGVQDN